MRIAYLAGLFPVRSETPVVNQITGLAARGHEVTIYGDRPRKPVRYHESIDEFGLLSRTRYRTEFSESFIHRWLGIGRLMEAHDPVSRRIMLKSLNPFVYGRRALTGRMPYQVAGFLPPMTADIIHAGFGEQGLKALRMIRLGALQGPLVTAFRGADLTRFIRNKPNVYRGLFRAGSRFMPVSRFFADKLLALGCPPERTVVLRTGINLRLFAFEPRTASASPRLVSVGRLVEKKAIADALRMTANLRREGVDVTYTVIGDGPLRASLDQLATELGISSSVRFLGSQDQDRVPALLAENDILVTPSVTGSDGDQEGIPNVIKEAMATGMPVVATDHAGIPELVSDGITGLLVPEHDPAALTRAVRTLCDQPSLWTRLAHAGRAIVEKEYDIEKQNDRLVEIYRQVAAEPQV